jgi:hypothetical protein
VTLRAALFAFIVVATGGLLTPLPARAAARTSNYQLDVQVTNGPFSLGGTTFPNFQATLTALNGTTLTSCTGSTFVTISIDSDQGTNWGSITQSASGANTCVYTYVGEPSAWSDYAVGLRTVTAQATVGGEVVASATATFTINKVATSMSCFVNTTFPNYQAGSTLQIAQQVQGPNSGFDPDWTQSTYDVTLTGPASMTYTDLAPDMAPGTGWLYIKAPTTPGQYTMTCTFNGYGNYAASTSSSVGVEISAFNPVGGIQIYTNPTTYNPYQINEMYIVFQPAAGGPPPTGRTFITIGVNSTATIPIASGGTLLVRLGPLLRPKAAGNQISITYLGDAYYRWTTANFSFINPPIPGNGSPSGGNGGKGGSHQATPSVTATGTPGGATPSAGGTQSASGGSSGSGSSGSSGSTPLLGIGLALLVLLLGGSGLALALRPRLAKSKLAVPSQPPYSFGGQQLPPGPRPWPPAGGPLPRPPAGS